MNVYKARAKSLVLKLNKYFYPEEIFILSFFILFLIYFLARNFYIIFWDPALSTTTIYQVLFPMFVFFILSYFKLAYKSIHQKKYKLANKVLWLAVDTLRIWTIFYITLIAHMNIKIQVPFINPYLFDNFYHNFDLWCSWFTTPLFTIRDWINNYIDLGPLYATGYESLYLLTFSILYLTNKKAFRLMFFATVSIISLGAITYAFFPAIGPFIYASSASLYTKEIQDIMLYKYELFKNSHIYSPYYLIQGVAAMPSLHTANTFAFVYYIWKYARKYSIIYIPMFLYIITDAVYTKYHYILDVVFGLLLAILCIYMVEKWYKKRNQILSKNIQKKAII